ncbi:Membrane-spanning 4-domains subfamily A member 8 [Trichoplax sp. H2]|nr:Membrane-spanning 4-domains subfamily A member 8 [Trichoplax sp. H2]|eukprot:RDD44217.1 Membrane-spanning 4-domains subfamily A member 8 [Trichoplax sp. H2]
MTNALRPGGFRSVPEHHAALLGTILITNGIISIIVGALDLSLDTIYAYNYIYVGAPIWSGIIYFIAGILSACSRKTKDIHLVNASFAFSLLTTICALVSTVLLTLGRAQDSNYNIYPLGMVGIAVSVLSFIFGLCGAVVASYGMDCDCCDSSQIPNGQYVYFDNEASQFGQSSSHARRMQPPQSMQSPLQIQQTRPMQPMQSPQQIQQTQPMQPMQPMQSMQPMQTGSTTQTGLVQHQNEPAMAANSLPISQNDDSQPQIS